MSVDQELSYFDEKLRELSFNSKPLINYLTIIAGEKKRHAGEVFRIISDRTYKVDRDSQLSHLYLMDSIIKNIGGPYVTHACQLVIPLFLFVFEKANEKVRQALYKLFTTWPDVLPADFLQDLTTLVRKMDPKWPVSDINELIRMQRMSRAGRTSNGESASVENATKNMDNQANHQEIKNPQKFDDIVTLQKEQAEIDRKINLYIEKQKKMVVSNELDPPNNVELLGVETTAVAESPGKGRRKRKKNKSSYNKSHRQLEYAVSQKERPSIVGVRDVRRRPSPHLHSHPHPSLRSVPPVLVRRFPEEPAGIGLISHPIRGDLSGYRRDVIGRSGLSRGFPDVQYDRVNARALGSIYSPGCIRMEAVDASSRTDIYNTRFNDVAYDSFSHGRPESARGPLRSGSGIPGTTTSSHEPGVSQKAGSGGAAPPSSNRSVPSILDVLNKFLAEYGSNAKSTASPPNLASGLSDSSCLDFFGSTSNLKNMRIRNDNIISLMRSGVQCSSCGLRFKDETTEYRKHLDWHFQRNSSDSSTSSKWRLLFCSRTGWISMDDTVVTMQEGRSGSPSESRVKGDTPFVSCVANTDIINDEMCPACREPFVTFWNESKGEWHYKDSVRHNGRAYHAFCIESSEVVDPVPAKPNGDLSLPSNGNLPPQPNGDLPPPPNDSLFHQTNGREPDNPGVEKQ